MKRTIHQQIDVVNKRGKLTRHASDRRVNNAGMDLKKRRVDMRESHVNNDDVGQERY